MDFKKLKTPVKKSSIDSLSREQLLEKRKSLKCRAEELNSQIDNLLQKGAGTDLRPEMKALHEYNDMKDLTQMVLGYLADTECTTVAEVHQRFNLSSDL